MKSKHLLSIVVLFVLLFSFYPGKTLSTSWAYSFVVWDGYIYVISDEYVTDIGNEIGHVTRHSDMKQYSGNFSNAYKKGTKYYSIQGINTDQAIAVEKSDGQYIKAFREAEYELRSPFAGFFDGEQGFNKTIVFSVVGILAIVLIYKVIKNIRLKG
ncbi:hypothetical protein [Bacillus sp. ISL-55]|uniref:hypothetical protein n=1 Tax=Bacillus sp. ISL-55 TaxID=2819134 RepID=UPI001BEA7C5C|nr:hypothetical protein [Bacillus sp. ISL-55]MBT2695690.1 hypothetical protein [Bacillus sp. ISL-55]